nr:YheC/YheD family protein [Neobacillus sp. Marseille-Q6967]
MISFGIMSLNYDSETSYFHEIAFRASLFDMECYHFIPTEISPQTLFVKGKKFNTETEQWDDGLYPLPEILYDRCFYGDDHHSKKCIPIVSWLKSRSDIAFLGYGLPNKLDLYHALNETILAPYLPPSQLVDHTAAVIKELNKQKKLIIKPINGSQGYGIYCIKKNHHNVHVKTEKNKKIISRIFPNEEKLIKWLNTLLTHRSYLLQPYLKLTNTDLQPFDIRILLQKNENGQWVERGRGIRTGNTGGILSNLSAGAIVMPFKEWSAKLPAGKKEMICNELDFVLSKLPLELEKKLSPLFEIGIDIGIAENGAIWILDINSKPGRKVLFQTHPDLKEVLYQAPLRYGKYIAENGCQERRNDYEKTLFH